MTEPQQQTKNIYVGISIGRHRSAHRTMGWGVHCDRCDKDLEIAVVKEGTQNPSVADAFPRRHFYDNDSVDDPLFNRIPKSAQLFNRLDGKPPNREDDIELMFHIKHHFIETGGLENDGCRGPFKLMLPDGRHRVVKIKDVHEYEMPY